MARQRTTANTAPDAPPSLEAVMLRLADGDGSATIDLYTYYFRQIAGAVRQRALRMGRTVDADDLRDLTWSTIELLTRRASAWNPDGASPWAWAARAIDGLIVHHLGPPHACDPDILLELPARPFDVRPPDGNAIAVLHALSVGNELIALLDEALRLADTSRNNGVFLEHLIQKSLGDPSPSDTVAQLTGLRPPAVRQIVRRTRTRLRTTVHLHGRFAPLAHLPLLQPQRRSASCGQGCGPLTRSIPIRNEVFA